MATYGRVLFVAAVIGLAGALRLESTKQEPEPLEDPEDLEEAPPRRPYTAVCITGDIGTLPFSSMHISLQKFVSHLNGTGIIRKNADFFAYVTLQGAPGREGWSYLGENTSEEQALYALYTVGPIQYKLAEDRYEVTKENMDQYVKNRETCFSNGVWQDSWRAMRRSVNQLVQWQKCLKMVAKEERITGKKYEVVVLARPDLAYKHDTELDLVSVTEGTVISQKDWIMVMPRNVADKLTGKKAKPLTCSPGESCCGTVGSSSSMLEYLTGIGGTTNFDSCDCGPSVNETGLKEHKTNLFIGRIITPELMQGSDEAMTDTVDYETVMTEHDNNEAIELI